MDNIQSMFGQDPALFQQDIQQQQQKAWQQDIQPDVFSLGQRLGNQAGGMFGNALGAATGYVDPRIADAQLMQKVQQEALADAQTQGINPAANPIGYGKIMANKYLQIGKPDKAFAVVQQIQKMETHNAEIELKRAQAAKALREESGPSHLSDMGKYQYELDRVTTALDQDPTNPRLLAMKANYEAKIERFSKGERTGLEKNIEMLKNKYGFPEDVAVGLQTGALAIVPTADGGVKVLNKIEMLGGKQGNLVWQSGSVPMPAQQGVTEKGAPPPYSQFQQQPTMKGEIGGVPGYKPQERLDKAIVDIGQDIEKAKVTDQKNTIQGVMQQFDTLKAKHGNVPGVGPVVGGLPTWMVPSEEGRQLRDSLQQAFNITLKDRSGAAVTPQEMARLKSEFASGAFRTEKDMRAALQRMSDIINKHEQGLISTYPEEVVGEFLKRTGRVWEVKTPVDVRIAYKSGRITKEEARTILSDMDKEGIK